MKSAERDRIDEKLAKNNLCYVLVTCAESAADGNMQVEMSYQGDAALASYLLQGAQEMIDDKEECSQSAESLSKVVSLAE